MKTTHEQTKALERIFKNLETGGKYVVYTSGPRWPSSDTVLIMDNFKPLIHWHHFGSSAEKATPERLDWIIANIFNMTPCVFEKTYMFWPPYKYDDDLLITYKNGRQDFLDHREDYSKYFIDNNIDNDAGREEALESIIDIETGVVLYIN